MKKCEYTRAGRQIKTLSTGQVETFKYVNQAKRASAKLQRDGGGLGCGVLRLVPNIKIGR